jgi:hypothetical protein
MAWWENQSTLVIKIDGLHHLFSLLCKYQHIGLSPHQSGAQEFSSSSYHPHHQLEFVKDKTAADQPVQSILARPDLTIPQVVNYTQTALWRTGKGLLTLVRQAWKFSVLVEIQTMEILLNAALRSACPHLNLCLAASPTFYRPSQASPGLTLNFIFHPLQPLWQILSLSAHHFIHADKVNIQIWQSRF